MLREQIKRKDFPIESWNLKSQNDSPSTQSFLLAFGRDLPNFFSDGYPPQTAGMTEGERDPRWPLAGITKPQFRGSPLPMAAGAGPTIAGMTTDM